MADAAAPRRFDFGNPAVVAVAFVYAGHEYVAGSEFPYERLGLGRWEMKGYWIGGLVNFTATESTQEMPGIASLQTADKLTRAERRAQRR